MYLHPLVLLGLVPLAFVGFEALLLAWHSKRLHQHPKARRDGQEYRPSVAAEEIHRKPAANQQRGHA